MPFKSELQRKFLWAVKPEIAKEFAEKTKALQINRKLSKENGKK